MFSMAINIAIGAVALWCVLFVVNRQAATSLFRWGKAGVGEAVRGVTNTNLVAQLNEAVVEATTKVNKGRQGMARIGAVKRSLERQLQDLRTEESQWMAKIQQVKAAGDPNNTARNYALQLATCREQLMTNDAQYKVVCSEYDDYSQDIIEGDRAIKAAKAKAASMQARLELSESQKAVAEFANGYDPNKITGDLAVAMDKVEAQINLNLGAADAARIGQEDRRAERADRALLRDAQADAILAEFDVQAQLPAPSAPRQLTSSN